MVLLLLLIVVVSTEFPRINTRCNASVFATLSIAEKYLTTLDSTLDGNRLRAEILVI